MRARFRPAVTSDWQASPPSFLKVLCPWWRAFPMNTHISGSGSFLRMRTSCLVEGLPYVTAKPSADLAVPTSRERVPAHLGHNPVEHVACRFSG